MAGKLVRSHKVTVSSGKRREKREMGQWRGKEGRWMERCTFSSMHLYTHTHTQSVAAAACRGVACRVRLKSVERRMRWKEGVKD